MRLLTWADRWLHRMLPAGRCYNRWLCERISYHDAMRNPDDSTDIQL